MSNTKLVSAVGRGFSDSETSVRYTLVDFKVCVRYS